MQVFLNRVLETLTAMVPPTFKYSHSVKEHIITASWPSIVRQTSIVTAKDIAKGEDGVMDEVSRVTGAKPTHRLL